MKESFLRELDELSDEDEFAEDSKMEEEVPLSNNGGAEVEVDNTRLNFEKTQKYVELIERLKSSLLTNISSSPEELSTIAECQEYTSLQQREYFWIKSFYKEVSLQDHDSAQKAARHLPEALS